MATLPDNNAPLPVKPRFRRRFQFSIRTLLVLFLVAGLALSYPAYCRERYWTQWRAIERLREMGVDINTDPIIVDEWLRMFVGEKRFCIVAWIDFEHQRLTPEMMSCVSDIFTVNSLTLRDCVVDDEDFALIANLPDIENVNIQNTNISDRGLSYLTRFVNLKSLTLLKTDVTSDGLVAYLNEMKNLQGFWVSGSDRITEDFLGHLRLFPSLTNVSLESLTITDKSEVPLKRMTYVKSFGFGDCDFDDEDMRRWVGSRYR